MDKLSEKLLKLVCSSSDGIQFYRIYRRMYLSPSELAGKLELLVSKGLVNVNQHSITPTKEGVNLAMQNALNYKKNNAEPQKWKAIPEQFVSHQLPINKPYAPSYAKFIAKSKND